MRYIGSLLDVAQPPSQERHQFRVVLMEVGQQLRGANARHAQPYVGKPAPPESGEYYTN
ncbi:hypothetical protein D3C77_704820 [compost metagenome]